MWTRFIRLLSRSFTFGDYACKDIAAILWMPIGTVKSRIARGVFQLLEILREHSPKPGVKRMDAPARWVGEPNANYLALEADGLKAIARKRATPSDSKLHEVH